MSSRNGLPAGSPRRSKPPGTPAPGTIPDARISKLGKRPEFVEAGVDFRACQCAKPVHAELFAAEAAHYRPVDHGAAEFLGVDVALFQIETLLGQIPDKASGKTVTGAGWVKDFFEQITRY